MADLLIAVLALFISISSIARATESTCFGTVSNGRVEDAVQLPSGGSNFTAYSSLGGVLGRTYVHSKVSEIVLAAYGVLEQVTSEEKYVYGETGWSSGGRFRPHRSHKNGLSVDFFVPIVDATGRSVPLPSSVSNKFGYNIDFDVNAKYKNYSIDFEAIAEHIYQLDVASKARGAGIALVIFDPPYLPRLFATKRGEYLRSKINFMKGNAWVRHDEHYHVDFAISCKPLKG